MQPGLYDSKNELLASWEDLVNKGLLAMISHKSEEDFNDTEARDLLYKYIYSDDSKLVLADDITFIGIYAFTYCDFLNEIVLPKKLKYIDAGAFENCSNLEKINIPDTIEVIRYNTFCGCGQLKSLTLPKDLKHIEEEAFKEMTELEDIIIPENIRIIGEDAFNGCTKLKNVVLPCNLTSIIRGAFAFCKSLETIKLPNTLKSIYAYAFSCSGLRQIAIPESVEIHSTAFNKCDYLKILDISDKTLNNSVNRDFKIWYDFNVKKGNIRQSSIDDLINSGKSFKEANQINLIKGR